MRADDNDLVWVSAFGLRDDVVRDAVLGEGVDVELADEFLSRPELLHELEAVGKRDRACRHDVGHVEEAAIEHRSWYALSGGGMLVVAHCTGGGGPTLKMMQPTAPALRAMKLL